MELPSYTVSTLQHILGDSLELARRSKLKQDRGRLQRGREGLHRAEPPKGALPQAQGYQGSQSRFPQVPWGPSALVTLGCMYLHLTSRHPPPASFPSIQPGAGSGEVKPCVSLSQAPTILTHSVVATSKGLYMSASDMLGTWVKSDSETHPYRTQPPASRPLTPVHGARLECWP